MTFSFSSFTIKDLATRTVGGVGCSEKWLFVLDCDHASFFVNSYLGTSRAPSVIWHVRLGHLLFRIISSFNKHGVNHIL